MIEILPETRGNLVAAKAGGTLTAQDYTDIWLPKLEAVIGAHGKIRALIYFDETFEGWDAGAMWQDAKFGFSHADDFEKIAVVGAAEWVETVVNLFGHLMQGTVETFPTGALEKAYAWIK